MILPNKIIMIDRNIFQFFWHCFSLQLQVCSWNSLGLISDRVKPKTRKIDIHSFPPWRSTIKKDCVKPPQYAAATSVLEASESFLRCKNHVTNICKNIFFYADVEK